MNNKSLFLKRIALRALKKIELHSYFILDIIDLSAVTQLVRKLYSGKKVQGNNFRFNMESKNVHLKKKKK